MREAAEAYGRSQEANAEAVRGQSDGFRLAYSGAVPQPPLHGRDMSVGATLLDLVAI